MLKTKYSPIFNPPLGGFLFYDYLALLAILCYDNLMEFFEDLNIKDVICPPIEAVPMRLVVYRLVDNIPAKIEDIWSYRKLYPCKSFGSNECIARSCSVYTDYRDLQKLQKLPKFKGKRIATIDIEEQDGVLCRTFANSHFSWWISRKFNLGSVKEVV